MNKFSLVMKRFGGFMKRNALYLMIILCIASVATVIALAVTQSGANGNNNNLNQEDIPSINNPNDNTDPDVTPDPDPEPDVTPEVQTFIMPTNGTISKEFFDTMLVWNATLDEFSTHLAVDFTSEDLQVLASTDGTVSEVGYNALDGYFISLVHDDGYKTVYKSLEQLSTLERGDKVEKGKNIGKMSTSQGTEFLDGNHLHFEVWKDGIPINPLEVLILDEK